MDPVQGGQPSRPSTSTNSTTGPTSAGTRRLIKQPLGLVSRLQKQIVADASNMGRAKATRDDRQEPDQLGGRKQSH